MSRGDSVPVGKIVGVHGVKGELKVLPYGDLSEFVWKTVSIETEDGTISYPVKKVRPHKGVFLFKLRGLNRREEAERFIGEEVSVAKEDLPPLPEGEYYYFELQGMDVVTEDGTFLGKLVSIFPTGSNDVYEVHGPEGEILIPVIEDVVLNVDLKRRTITVRLLEGLLPDEK